MRPRQIGQLAVGEAVGDVEVVSDRLPESFSQIEDHARETPPGSRTR